MKDITYRRAAALREMASLGVCGYDAAMAMYVSPSLVDKIKKQFNIVMPLGKGGPKPRLKQAILRDYPREVVSAEAMAERYGSTSNSITVTIHKLRKEGRIPWGDRCLNGKACQNISK